MKKRLYRSDDDRMLLGVCAGLGDYIGVDPTVVRLAFAGLAVLWGYGLALYVLAAIIVPREASETSPADSSAEPPRHRRAPGP